MVSLARRWSAHDDEPVTVALLVASGPYASWSYRGEVTVRVAADAAGQPQVDGLGQVLVHGDEDTPDRWWALPRHLRVP